MAKVKEKLSNMINELIGMGYSLDESKNKLKADIDKCEKEIQEYYDWIDSRIDCWIDNQIEDYQLSKHGLNMEAKHD